MTPSAVFVTFVIAIVVATSVQLVSVWFRGRTPRAKSESQMPKATAEFDVEYAAINVPSDISQAWVQFMRDDVARSVNAFNNRLNAILASTRELQSISSGPRSAVEIQRIQDEVKRAVNITSRLLRRADAMAPETVPGILEPFVEPPERAAHIVVVDDDSANRRAVARLLQHFGHLVTPCSNGVEAFEVIRSGPVDCIVSDLNMPTLGGKSLYEQLEEELPNVAAQFVFVTGDYTRPASREFLEKSGQPVVAKPYDVGELLSAVAMVLRRVGAMAPGRDVGEKEPEVA